MKKDEKKNDLLGFLFRLMTGYVVAYLFVWLTVICAVGYVVIHFVVKYW